MKKLLLALAIVSTSVFAQEESKLSGCDAVEDMARLIITKRYEGIAAKKVIDIFKDNKAMKMIAIAAYKEPSYYTESIVNKAINEFADKWYLLCLEAQDK